MNYTLTNVSVQRAGLLRLTFSDGLSGDYDLTDTIASGQMFASLADTAFFAQVALGPGGRTFGWNLDDEGHEIDFCANAARIEIEVRAVSQLARSYRSRGIAAE